MWITMVKTFSGKTAGEKYEVDETTAKEWIDNGIASKCETDPVAETLKGFEKSLQERDERLVKEIRKRISASSLPTIVAKSDDEKPEENFWVCVGKFGSQSSSPAEKEKAYNILANKYNSVSKTSVMSQGTGTAGGFLVPVKYINELQLVEGYEGVAFPDRVHIVPCEVRTVNLPALDQTQTPSAGQSAFYGGVSLTWVAEGNAPSNYTQPAFKQITLTVQKGIAVTQVTNELLAMSPISVESTVTSLIKDASRFNLEYNIFAGAGAGQLPFAGIIDNAATISVKRQGSGAVSLTDLANMWTRLTPQSIKRAVWVMSPTALGQLPLGTPYGSTATNLVMLPSGGQQDFDLRFLGLPILTSECCSTLGTAGDVLLCDLRHYAVALNKQVTVDASPHHAFPSDLTTYRCTFLAMGQPQLTAPITLSGGGTVSPFIQLGSTSS